jgi:hypothetical protein
MRVLVDGADLRVEVATFLKFDRGLAAIALTLVNLLAVVPARLARLLLVIGEPISLPGLVPFGFIGSVFLLMLQAGARRALRLNRLSRRANLVLRIVDLSWPIRTPVPF